MRVMTRERLQVCVCVCASVQLFPHVVIYRLVDSVRVHDMYVSVQ